MFGGLLGRSGEAWEGQNTCWTLFSICFSSVISNMFESVSVYFDISSNGLQYCSKKFYRFPYFFIYYIIYTYIYIYILFFLYVDGLLMDLDPF